MHTADIIFIAGELIQTLSYFSFDMMWLRLLTIFADVCFIIGTIVIGLTSPGMLPTFVFTLITLIVNIGQVMRLILLTQPIIIPEQLKPIYTKLFNKMTTFQFMTFYKQAKIMKYPKEKVIINKQELCELMVLVSGELTIFEQDNLISTINDLNIIGETSILTDEKPIANVKTNSDVELLTWSRESIEDLKNKRPKLYDNLRYVLTKEIIHKLKSSNQI